MARKLNGIELTRYDDLFKTDAEREADQQERVQIVPAEQVFPYARQPYSVDRPSADLVRLMDSIERTGIAEPLIVRPRSEGGYEIISGHRRDYCAKVVGLDTRPVIVRNYSDEDADILVVDYNINRENLLPSEKAKAYTLTWDGSQYVGTATDTNGVLSQYYFRTNISGVTVSQRRNVLTVTATKDAAAQLNGYISSDYGYALDVEGTEAVLLEPSNGSNYQACAALTSLPDPVWAYIHFKVNIVEERGSLTINKVDATGAPLAGAELLLETSTDGKTWTEVGRVTTDKTGIAKWSDLKIGVQYRITEVKAPAGYTLLTEPLFTGTLDNNDRDITITACNSAGFVLPFTGGVGFTTYFLFAALALMAGVYFCKKSDFMKEKTK